MSYPRASLPDAPLSPEGARIEHVRPLPVWNMCFLALPRALGCVRLQGEVPWSRVVGRKQGAKGEWQLYYQSGLTFLLLTPERRAGLTAAQEIVKAAEEDPSPEQPAGTARGGARRKRRERQESGLRRRPVRGKRMHACRILAHGPEDEPLWVRLYVHKSGTAGRLCSWRIILPHKSRAG